LYKLLCARVLLLAHYLPQFTTASTFTPTSHSLSHVAVVFRSLVAAPFGFALVLLSHSHRASSSQVPLSLAALLPRLSAPPFV
jgi:hypothetical protein